MNWHSVPSTTVETLLPSAPQSGWTTAQANPPEGGVRAPLGEDPLSQTTMATLLVS